MINHVLAVASAAFFATAVAACGAPSTDIADLSVVTTLPKEVGPGGFEKTIGVDGVATGVFFKAALSDCGPEVDRVARAWAAQQALTEKRRALDKRSATLEFTSERFPNSALIVSYVLGSRGESGRLHVTYRGTSEKRSLSVQDLEGLAMPTLIDSLVSAARCDASG